MAPLLTETCLGIKRLLSARVEGGFACCAIRAYIEVQSARGHGTMTRNRRTKKEVDAGSWEQTETPHGEFREIERLAGHRFPLSYDRIEALKAQGFSADELYAIVAPRRTLARRKESNAQLTVAESDRVLRLERIAQHADRVFGNHEKAQRWLRSEIIALGGVRPIDLLVSETGANVVFEELIRIDYGMFA